MRNAEQVLAGVEELLTETPVLLTVNQAAAILNVSRASVYRLLDSGDLDAIRINLTGNRKPTVRVTSDSVSRLFRLWVGAPA